MLPLASLASLGCSGMLAAGAMADLQELYAAGECKQVIARSTEYASFLEADPARVAEANFLKAQCFAQLGRRAEAIAVFRYVAEQHPTSPYAYQARVMIEGLELGDTEPPGESPAP